MSESDVCTLDVGEDYVRLSNGVDWISYNMRLGTFSFGPLNETSVYFDRAYCSVTTKEQIYTTRDLTYRGVNSIDFMDPKGPAKAVVIRLQAPDKSAELNIRLSMVKGMPGYTCIVQFRNLSDEMRVLDFGPLVIEVDSETRTATGRKIESLRYFRNGSHSWELSQARGLDAGENVSHWFSVLNNPDAKMMLFMGFLTADTQLSQVVFTGGDDGKHLSQILAKSIADSVLVDRKGAMASEELYVTCGGPPHMAADRFAEAVSQRMKASPPKESPTGWCSWYYYLARPNEQDILENVDVLRKRFGKRIQWIQLDDGYQKAVGDWSENARFSAGLDALAQKVLESGFKPGIWVAPFVASEHSQLFKTKPSWFLADNDGKPIKAGDNPLWLGNYYSLDLSRKDVLDHIKGIFAVLKSQGYDYFKIDFLHHALMEAKRANSLITRAAAFRAGLQVIREAVGDSFVLGCGAPLGQCVGIVDGMRIGNDIATTWRYDWGGGVYECSINTMTRSFMHRRLWTNDPDCVLVRQDDTSLTLEEVQLWATIASMSGGTLMLSDKMEEVSEERLRIIDKLMPSYTKGARGIGVFEESEPRIFALPVETVLGKWSVVAIVNLSEKAINVSCPFEDIGLDHNQTHHIFEFWKEEYEGVSERSLDVMNLKPHSCRFFCVRPESEVPTILSTSIHYTQGAIEVRDVSWDNDAWELSARLNIDTHDNERIFVVFGREWIPEDAFIDEKKIQIEMIAPEVIAIASHFKRNQELLLRFSRQM